MHLQRSAKQFAKKSILQIEAIPENRTLISLSDNIISVHNLDKINFPLITSLTKTKGATHFSLDIKKNRTLTGETQFTVRLCVVVKYLLFVFYWKNNDFIELRTPIKMVDIAKVTVWCNNLLYAGLKNQYVQINVETGNTNSLFSITSEPIILPLSEQRLALCRDKQTYIFDSEGRPLLEYAISWSDYPTSVANDSLYLMAIQSESVVEILTNSTKKTSLIQKIDFTSLGTRKLKSISKWKNRPGQLVVYSENYVILLKCVSHQQQIRLLQDSKYFDLALEVSLPDCSDFLINFFSHRLPKWFLKMKLKMAMNL